MSIDNKFDNDDETKEYHILTALENWVDLSKGCDRMAQHWYAITGMNPADFEDFLYTTSTGIAAGMGITCDPAFYIMGAIPGTNLFLSESRLESSYVFLSKPALVLEYSLLICTNLLGSLFIYKSMEHAFLRELCAYSIFLFLISLGLSTFLSAQQMSELNNQRSQLQSQQDSL